MTRRFFSLHRAGDDDAASAGVVVPIFCLLLLTLVTLIGLAVDAGNLYRVRRELQRSADAAIAAALAQRLHLGWRAVHGPGPVTDPGVNDGWITHVAEEVAKRNLLSSNIPTNKTLIASSFDDRTDLAQITLRYSVPAFLFPYIVGQSFCGNQGGRFVCPLIAVSRGQLNIADIGLVLDTSGSMACPKVGSCDCRKTASCDPASNRMQVVLDAVQSRMVPLFNPNRDRLSVTFFNLAAKVVFSMVGEPATPYAGVPLPFGVLPDGSSDRYTDFLASLSDPGPMGNSNQCDGLLESLNDMRRATLPRIVGSEKTFFVMLSDGAPTAGRFLYAKPTNALAQSLATNNVPNDFLQYIHKWTGVADASDIWTFPSPLVAAHQAIASNPDGFGYRNEGTPPLETFQCGELVDQKKSESTRAYAGKPFTPCIQSFDFSIPGLDPNRIVSRTKKDWEAYKKQFYHCTIEVADFIRANNGVVFVIGVGPDPVDMSTFYQDSNDYFSRKSIFASRVADDWYHGYFQFTDPQGHTTPPLADYTEYQNYQPTEDLERNGIYLPASTVDDVAPLFEEIGRNILTRLIG